MSSCDTEHIKVKITKLHIQDLVQQRMDSVIFQAGIGQFWGPGSSGHKLEI